MSDDDGALKEVRPRGASKGISRRSLCISIGGVAVLLGVGGLRYVGKTPVCRPPGGQDEDRLIAACIRCELCYEVCPRNVIVPAHAESGIVNMRTPVMSFDEDYCDFCARDNGGVPRCVEVCPTKALSLDEDARAETVIIGRAVINERECLAFRDTGCRFCYDACPYEAIVLDGGDFHPTPRVLPDVCNGCGACESVCVSLESGSIALGAQQRAIVVEAIAALEEG